MRFVFNNYYIFLLVCLDLTKRLPYIMYKQSFKADALLSFIKDSAHIELISAGQWKSIDKGVSLKSFAEI